MPIDMPPDTEHTTVLAYQTNPGDPAVAAANRTPESLIIQETKGMPPILAGEAQIH